MIGNQASLAGLPTVSVIIAAFATERWNDTGKAVASVRAQTVPVLETILVIDHNPALLDRAEREFEDVIVLPNTGSKGASGGRNSGVAASQSNTSDQEAKDFKVVIALDDPPEDIRPGLSCTGKIVTATKPRVLTIPIQALTVRQRGDLEPKKPNAVQAASNIDPVAEKAKKQELQGVFMIRDGKAEFVPVTTGITGSTDIEVLSGLKDNDQIITGTYKIIRTLRNFAKVKVNNQIVTTTSES